MSKSHYETLGVSRFASDDEIRSAFRRLAKLHHPDRAGDANAAVFVAVTQAYEALRDPVKRRAYDLQLDEELERKRPKTVTASVGAAKAPKGKPASTVASDVAQMTSYFSRGRHQEAEKLARQILGRDSRQPVPYAVLGDIARRKGELKDAARMYAYAVQMDPRNALYRVRHEETLKLLARGRAQRTGGSKVVAPAVAVASVIAMCTYLVADTESALLPGVTLISSWTLGFMVIAVMAGVAVGAGLSVAGLLDRFAPISGRPNPTASLAVVAAVSFWAAGALYALAALALRAFNVSTSRVFLACLGVTALLALSAEASSNLNALQVVKWGGNLVYLGAVAGWMVSDSLRRAA